MKKRILILSVAYLPFVGGAEVAVRQITDRISDIEFDMITLNLSGQEKREEQIGNVKVYRIGAPGYFYKLLFPFVAWWKAVRLHKARPYDAVWSIMASFSGFAALFFKYSHPDVPFILTLQEGDPLDSILRKVILVRPLFRAIFRKADRIQAISTFLAHFAEHMGAKVPAQIIPNGVDMGLFSQTFPLSERASDRTKMGVLENETLLVTTSRLIEKNGIADVIDALVLLPETVKFLIIGIGPLEIDLRQKVAASHLEQRVLFQGFVEYSRIPRYLAASDIFIRPSLSEGMGNSFIEAMAAGVPEIATPVGGIPDFLEDRVTGLFCHPHDPESIKSAVEQVVNDPALRQTLIKNGQELSKKYDWSEIAQKMNQSIFNVTNEKS